MRALLTLALLLAGVLGSIFAFGWWHASTHATFYMDLRDVATASKFENVKDAQLEFLDESGKVLARGKTDDGVGVVWVSHPTAGYCGPNLAQPAYRQCFDAHAGWLLTWVPRVRAASIAAGPCRIERAPLQFSVSRESAWLWWVPLPHVGGVPYTSFNASLQIDGRSCNYVPARA